jgi:hypothetical protein
MTRVLLSAFIAVLFLPASAFSQSINRESHFGVIASFSPESKFNDSFKILFDAERTDARSRDLSIGFIVRGRQLGGDWGVSYIQKQYKDGSIVDRTVESCEFAGQCLAFGNLDIMQDVQLRGLAIHKFAPFVTIQRRVQIGFEFGGGIAWAKGTAERHELDLEFVPPNGTVQTETTTQVDAKALFLEDLDPMPIWKAELAAAVIIAPGLKARFGGGLNWGNYPSFTITGLYLFGAK